jgi:hypothetical protein
LKEGVRAGYLGGAMAKDPKSATQELLVELRVPVLTVEEIPTQQLMEEQGIDGPQGLDAVTIPWPFTEVDGY